MDVNEQFLSDEQILELCKQTRLNYLFENVDLQALLKVYPSSSEIDFDFCSTVALFTQDKEQVLRLFDNSLLSYRSRAKTLLYRDMLANKAIKRWTRKLLQGIY